MTSKAKPRFYHYIAAGISVGITLLLLGIVIGGVLRAAHVEWP